MSEVTELAAGLVRLAHLVQHVFADVSRSYDLTPQQTQLLCVLVDGPFGMTELSRSLHLEKSSLTGLVDRVERRGLVTRVRDDRDRRACRIELTAHGASLGAAAHAEVTDRLDAMADDLPPTDRDHLTTTIAALLAPHPTATART